MKIAYYELGKDMKILNVVEDDLEVLKKLVGCYVESFPLTRDLVLICDKEGKLKGKKVNTIVDSRIRGRKHITGNFFICGTKGMTLRGLTESEIDEHKLFIS